jgi:dolichol-phosphate mannosyltransferase
VEGEDKTMEKLREFSSVNPNVKLDYNQKRLGLGKGHETGLSLVSHRTDYVLTMDADLNHRPEEIGRLLEAVADADIIVGRRSLRHGMVGELPLFRRVVSGTTNWLLRKAFRFPPVT